MEIYKESYKGRGRKCHKKEVNEDANRADTDA